jgi:hypothetical protein
VLGRGRTIWRLGRCLSVEDVTWQVGVNAFSTWINHCDHMTSNATLHCDMAYLDRANESIVAYQGNIPPAGDAPFVYILKGAVTEL